jgi:heme-degrading monooxygenase HmoA
MFTRATWSKLSQGTTVEQALTNYRERVLPSMQTQEGFLGAVILANRETGEGVSATYWQTAEAMAASEAMATAGRAQASGVEILEVDRFEVILDDRTGPAKVGTFVRSNDGRIAPAQIDALVAFVRDTAIPAGRSQQGYRSSRVFANRATGRVVVSTAWETAADRQASEAVMSGYRRQAAEIGQAPSPVQVSLYEVVLAELTPAAQQAASTAAGAA